MAIVNEFLAPRPAEAFLVRFSREFATWADEVGFIVADVTDADLGAFTIMKLGVGEHKDVCELQEIKMVRQVYLTASIKPVNRDALLSLWKSVQNMVKVNDKEHILSRLLIRLLIPVRMELALPPAMTDAERLESKLELLEDCLYSVLCLLVST